jgi:HTH-type transcriptional regulator, glycine betaine synthesis regulator
MARRAAELKVADQIGVLMDFWGFKRVHGRVWSILFLAQAPLSAAEIRKRLGVSVGATSMALTELRRWGAVREVRTGDRSAHFEPETNIWRLVARVLQDRERRLLDETLEVLSSAMQELRTEGATVAAKRVEKLVWLTRLARGMLDMLASRGELAAEDTLKMKV